MYCCWQAATANLQTLSSKLVKARHCLHSVNLKCEAVRIECDKAKQDVEANDVAIEAMVEEEQRLKMAYVESKLAYEKAHAEKYARAQLLKQLRQEKVAASKERDSIGNSLAARQCDWTKVHDQHTRIEAQAKALSDKLESVEKDKEAQRKRAQHHREEVDRYSAMYDALKRELDVVHASAAAV